MADTTGSLVLYQLPAAMGLPISESPPCAKVEVYLKLTGTPYVEALGDTRKSPTKLVPFVQWPDGELQAESGDIVARLEAQHGLDRAVDPARLARGRAVVVLAEEILYDATLYDRFVTPEGARHQRKLTTALVARFVPAFLAPLGAVYVDWTQRRRARGSRMADPETGYAAAIDALDRIVELLGDDSFLCGDAPSTVDCAIWPLVVHAGATPNPTPLRDAPAARPTLVDWVVRFGERAGCPVSPAQIHA